MVTSQLVLGTLLLVSAPNHASGQHYLCSLDVTVIKKNQQTQFRQQLDLSFDDSRQRIALGSQNLVVAKVTGYSRLAVTGLVASQPTGAGKPFFGSPINGEAALTIDRANGTLLMIAQTRAGAPVTAAGGCRILPSDRVKKI
jgi:hypothetical protein